MWPFNFDPKNQVAWLQTRRGLRFDRFGQAFSSEQWAVNPGNTAFTIQFWLRPAEPDNHAQSPIFSIYGGDIYGLAVFNRLITEDVQRQYMEWVNGNPTQLGATAQYVFDDHGNILHNRTGSAPDLVIPTRYRPLTPTILEFPHPFKLSDVEDTIVNILGFIPFGLLVMCYFLITSHTAREAFVRTIILGALTSLGIELLQVFLPTRDSSILDVINNVLGTVAGSGLATLVNGLWPRTLRRHI